MRLPKLDGYWIDTFLSKISKDHAMRVAKFFMDRVEYAAQTKDWQYRPCNHGPYCQTPLLFRESPEFGALLRQVSQWMMSHKDDNLFQHRAGELFNVMFKPYNAELIGFFLDWIETATPADICVISQILREGHPDFIFENRQFIIRFLDKANQYGKDLLRDASSALFGSTISGVRSGTPGEPFPQDIRMKTEAESALKEIPTFSPAYKLYEDLKKHADYNIKRSLREREAFDE
jgi:hypothetical protein